ncbi:hypothetical protein ES708_14905 [subsurface metagenome]
MLKITNPLGDIKTGRQGEAVYQRKYGEQIRRTVSPKRAIPSQRQIDHRQLYRAALAWRSQLSLANRRYLEGYCISHGIIDDYGVPLTWSRFALKVYLQAVRFAIIEKPSFYLYWVSDKFERYEDVGAFNYTPTMKTSTWKAQTFTPQISHDLTKVELYLYREGTIGTVTVSIRNTDASHLPTGGDLVSNSFNGMELGTSEAWKAIALAYSRLFIDTEYAIVTRLAGGSSFNWLKWRGTANSNPYTRGEAYTSYDSGVTWTHPTVLDMGFREYGKYEVKETISGLIHVRHPALLAVVQKRGELIVKEYDTLSSLDGEYLTKQVGLDVEVDDFIEATTWPGIEYAYPVR